MHTQYTQSVHRCHIHVWYAHTHGHTQSGQSLLCSQLPPPILRQDLKRFPSPPVALCGFWSLTRPGALGHSSCGVAPPALLALRASSVPVTMVTVPLPLAGCPWAAQGIHSTRQTPWVLDSTTELPEVWATLCSVCPHPSRVSRWPLVLSL